MKKILCLVLAAMMVISMAACTQNPAETNAPTTKPSEAAPTTQPTEPEDNGPQVVDVSELLNDASKWTIDGEHSLKDGVLFYDNLLAGDYCAAMLNEKQKDATYKFTLTINTLAEFEDLFWDTELLIMARASKPASSWQDDGSQTGYCLTSWGDMSKVAVGRAGHDTSVGEFEWNVNDGKPHEIEFTVMDVAEGVRIVLKVDGQVVCDDVDTGAIREDKPDRPTSYPEAGSLVIRCKWLEATVE